jgi:hypothetical protein
MWAHYAKDHSGVVFQVYDLHEEGGILSNVKKVSYEDKPLSFFSLDELIDWALFGIDPDYTKIFYTTHAYLKSKHWKYEEEWRVVEFCQNSEEDKLYLDRKFNSKQLTNIYFGCNSSSDDVERIRLIAERINPSIGVYKGEKSPNEYALVFKKI